MKKLTLVLLTLVTSIILIACNNNKLEGTWQEFNTSSKGEEIIFTKNEVTADDTVFTYKISENKKHLVIQSGGLEESLSFEISGDRLTLDGDTYYKQNSKSYKEQNSKMEKNAETEKQKQKKEQDEQKQWEKNVESATSEYSDALKKANENLLNELLIKIEGTWANINEKSTKDYANYNKTDYTFTREEKLDFNYNSKSGFTPSITETTKKGSGMMQFNYEGDLYLDFSDNLPYSLEDKTPDSEKELADIRDKTTKLKELSLETYLTELKQKREGNTFSTDYINVTIVDNIGDLEDKEITLNFPESDTSILQIYDFLEFKDYKKQ